MYAYIELSNTIQTDSIIQSLSWMNYIPTPNDNLLNLYEGWLATGNTNQIVSVTYTSTKSDENFLTPDRTNFNLRAHQTNVRHVSWNIPYQKLATVDSKGVIFVWIKHENRWSLELINDRNHPVTAMSWSYDGRMTVICYQDGFILAGSVTGQRYWSTVLNMPQTTISAVTWMPDGSHVIFGTTTGQLIVMDDHGNTTDILTLSTQPIRQLIYSCNKFYPEAPDNNATRFVNSDYILACSLEDGQVLFLTNHQDQFPITINTALQNIKIDWSSPSEILIVGGHQLLDDGSYRNQVIFYTRRGEFLDRVNIPQTTQPLSALCWAHGNEIVFVACGSCVYTIWIIHKPIPSMFTLCQMRIKQYLLNNSLENVDKLNLPNNLKENLLKYYRSTIKGFLPDQKTLHSFICNPLKSHLRLQCTMKRVDNDRETNHISDAIYVLYLEHLGGLIPLLTAKRTSKICPNFIIFNPEISTNNLSSTSSEQNSPQLIPLRSNSNPFRNISNLPQSKNRSNLITNRNSIYIAETDVNNTNENALTTKNHSNWNSDINSDDENDENINDLTDKKSKQRYTNRLCTIAANIWGTRFKFYGHSTHLPEILGSVTYKTSFLHLQPRQMTVTVSNNYNLRKPIKKLINPSKPNNDKINSSSVRPISSPYIQVTEPLLQKSSLIHHIDDVTGDNNNQSISENCFEPEAYRNLSSSDPTLNQTKRLSERTISVSVLPHIQPEIETQPLQEDIPIKKSPRHRIMSCTSGMNDPNDTSFYIMQNRPPLWNEQSQVYQLDFGGRVTLESAKNFQIEFKGKQVIQFGRIENNCYTLDFEWPFSPLQAFAVALANITQRLK